MIICRSHYHKIASAVLWHISLAITTKTTRPCPLIWVWEKGFVLYVKIFFAHVLMFFCHPLQLEFPAQFPCLLHIAMCSALCNDSILQYNPDKRNYEKIGESTEVALRVLVEKVCGHIWLSTVVEFLCIIVWKWLEFTHILDASLLFKLLSGRTSWFWFYAFGFEYVE